MKTVERHRLKDNEVAEGLHRAGEVWEQNSRTIVQALGEPEMRQRMADLGAEPVGDTPAEFGQFIAAEIAKWAKVIKASGIEIE